MRTFELFFPVFFISCWTVYFVHYALLSVSCFGFFDHRPLTVILTTLVHQIGRVVMPASFDYVVQAAKEFHLVAVYALGLRILRENLHVPGNAGTAAGFRV